MAFRNRGVPADAIICFSILARRKSRYRVTLGLVRIVSKTGRIPKRKYITTQPIDWRSNPSFLGLADTAPVV